MLLWYFAYARLHINYKVKNKYIKLLIVSAISWVLYIVQIYVSTKFAKNSFVVDLACIGQILTWYFAYIRPKEVMRYKDREIATRKCQGKMKTEVKYKLVCAC